MHTKEPGFSEANIFGVVMGSLRILQLFSTKYVGVIVLQNARQETYRNFMTPSRGRLNDSVWINVGDYHRQAVTAD